MRHALRVTFHVGSGCLYPCLPLPSFSPQAFKEGRGFWCSGSSPFSLKHQPSYKEQILLSTDLHTVHRALLSPMMCMQAASESLPQLLLVDLRANRLYPEHRLMLSDQFAALCKRASVQLET